MDIFGLWNVTRASLTGRQKREKRTKIFVLDFLYSIDRITLVIEKVEAKIEKLVGPNVSNAKACMKKLLRRAD